MEPADTQLVLDVAGRYIPRADVQRYRLTSKENASTRTDAIGDMEHPLQGPENFSVARATSMQGMMNLEHALVEGWLPFVDHIQVILQPVGARKFRSTNDAHVFMLRFLVAALRHVCHRLKTLAIIAPEMPSWIGWYKLSDIVQAEKDAYIFQRLESIECRPDSIFYALMGGTYKLGSATSSGRPAYPVLRTALLVGDAGTIDGFEGGAEGDGFGDMIFGGQLIKTEAPMLQRATYTVLPANRQRYSTHEDEARYVTRLERLAFPRSLNCLQLIFPGGLSASVQHRIVQTVDQIAATDQLIYFTLDPHTSDMAVITFDAAHWQSLTILETRAICTSVLLRGFENRKLALRIRADKELFWPRLEDFAELAAQVDMFEFELPTDPSRPNWARDKEFREAATRALGDRSCSFVPFGTMAAAEHLSM